MLRDMNERRFPRYQVDRPLRAVVAPRTPWSMPLRGRCLVISEGGIDAILPEHLAPGRIVYVELAPALKVCAEVRNRRSFHYGLEFMQVNEAERKAIKELCESYPPSQQV
jgi:PilZ domain-containing protein